MAKQKKDAKKTVNSKKQETKKKNALPKSATAVKKETKVSTNPVAKKATPETKTKKPPLKTASGKKSSTANKAVAKAATAIKKKTVTASARKSAEKKAKPSVKSTAKTTKPSATKTKKQEKPAKAAKPAKNVKPPKAAKSKADAKAPAKKQIVAARRAEEARPAKDKEKKPVIAKTEAPPTAAKSKTAEEVSKSLLRRKSSSKGDKSKPVRPIAFTLDEALEIAKTKSGESDHEKGNGARSAQPKPEVKAKKSKAIDNVKQENRVLGAASVADILGYNPESGPKRSEEDDIPAKFKRYYKLLVELREHVMAGLDTHTRETLKRSAKEDSGDLSSYSQHMADAGTDTFDRDFALSLVSSEQDALYEIEDAIRRIKRGTYGICEITGKPIKKERLIAVPFAKFSVEGQIEYEQTNRKSAYRGGAFSDSSDDTVQFLDEDSDE